MKEIQQLFHLLSFHFRQKAFPVLTIAIMVTLSSSSFAAVKFIGGGGNSLFTNAANWEGGVLPVVGEDIDIKADCLFDQVGAVAYGKLKMKDGAILTWMNPGLVLNVLILADAPAGGTVDMSNGGILQIRKEWNAIPAYLNFIPGSGTVYFNNTLSNTEINAGFHSFHNIILESDTKALKLADHIQISGDLNILTGTLKSQGNTISIAGNWSNSGSFEADTGAVHFTGCTVTMSNSSGLETFYNLLIPACVCVIFNDSVDVLGTFTNPAGDICDKLNALQTNFSPNAWLTQGNSIDDENQYLGTLNDADLRLKTNGQDQMIITRDGKVGIGTLTPASPLDVNSDARIHGLTLGKGAGSINSNATLGLNSLNSNTTGASNTAVGFSVLEFNTTGANNTGFGASALHLNNSGDQNTAVGVSALRDNTSGSFNLAAGNGALSKNTVGQFNAASGVQAMLNNLGGSQNNALGFAALRDNISGNSNVAIGHEAMLLNTVGSENTAIGYRAGVSTPNLNNATAVGANALVSQSNSLVLGNNADVGIGTSTPAAKLHLVGDLLLEDGTQGAGKVLTSDASGLASWQVPIDNVDDGDADPANEFNTNVTLAGSELQITDGGGTKSVDLSSLSALDNDWTISGVDQYSSVSGNVGIGTNTPSAKLEVAGGDARINALVVGKGGSSVVTNTAIGVDVLANNASGSSNTGVGNGVLADNTTGFANSALGQGALLVNTTGNQNTAMGQVALAFNTTGGRNTAFGNRALWSNTSGTQNTAIGWSALENATIGANLIGIGPQALFNNLNASNNIGIGSQSLYNNTTGASNVAIGTVSMTTNTTGFNNTVIGHNADVGSGNLNNATAIGANAVVIQSNSLILGNNTDIGIGTNAPSAKLHLIGDLIVDNGTQGAGKVLTSDAGGYATWEFPVDDVNDADADPTNEYNTNLSLVGTDLQITDGGGTKSVDLSSLSGTDGDWIISGSNQYSAVAGNVGVGTTTPAAKLDVAGGDALVNGITVGKGGSSFRTNTALGINALFDNTTGSSNTAIGHGALTENTTGAANAALGQGALLVNTSGSNNTAIGQVAMSANTTGVRNTAIGNRALWSNSTGGQNTALGYKALEKSTIASNLIGIGYEALVNNTSGPNNVGIGSQALFNTTTGSSNVALGTVSMVNNTTGFKNTTIGHNSDVTSGNLTNATALGADAEVDASNKIRLGNGAITSIEGQVNFTTSSDARIKDRIQENVPGLEFINKLRPVTYHLNLSKRSELMGSPSGTEATGKEAIENTQWTGFLAQDVERAASDINYDFSGVDNTGKVKGIRYSSFVVPLVKAVQEQQEMITDLQQIISRKDAQLEEMKTKLDQLISRFESLSSKDSTKVTTLSDVPFLEQNEPNPFTNETTIKYYLPSRISQASIRIFDIAGKPIKDIALIGNGHGAVRLQVADLPSGSYACQLMADGKYIETMKMIVIK